MKTVLMIEAQMKKYRLPFYEMLYQRLRCADVELVVAYSDPLEEELQKLDNCSLPPEYGLKVEGSWLFKDRVLYQPLLREIRSADLVISEHAFKMIFTYYLLLLSRFGHKRVAFWGHGENRQGNRSTLLERSKKRTLNWVRWWFAYTIGTADYLHRQGVPAWKITTVQNSVDTRGIKDHIRSLGPEAKLEIRASLGIPATAPVGIFVGSLHKLKSVALLLEASRLVRESVHDFHLIIVGGGPEEKEVRESAQHSSWIHCLGSKFGREKAKLLACADVFLLPGAVGLAILDAFAAELPLVTTTLPFHGPEIEYLEPGCNGVITSHGVLPFAQSVARLLTHPKELNNLREGARRSADKYSIENMVQNFSSGIMQCLALPKGAWSMSNGSDKKGSLERFREEKQGKNSPLPDRARRRKPAEALPSPRRTHELTVIPTDRSVLTTSWDDGHPLDLRVAELLSKYGLKGTFYVPRSGQRNVMNESQIRELSRSFEIGGHTMDHRAIDRCSDPDSFCQLSGSRDWIEQVTGKSCRVFCFPGGRFRKRQLKLVRGAGFEAVRTVELLSTAHPRCIDGLYVIPTTIQAFPHGPSAYAKNALKRFSITAVVRLNNALLSRDWVELARQLFLRAMELGGVFHLWGHSWEIEEQAQWKNLETLLKNIWSWREEWRVVTNGELCAHAG